MSKHSVLAFSSAIALALASFASAAQDVSKSAPAKKPVASTPSKAGKPAAPTERSIGASTKGAAERLGGKQTTPTADHKVPGASSNGCHGHESDA